MSIGNSVLQVFSLCETSTLMLMMGLYFQFSEETSSRARSSWDSLKKKKNWLTYSVFLTWRGHSSTPTVVDMQKIIQEVLHKSPVCVGNSFVLVIHAEIVEIRINLFLMNSCRDLQAVINLVTHETDQWSFFCCIFIWKVIIYIG